MPDLRRTARPGSRGAAVVELTCVVCGAVFQRYVSQVRDQTQGKYCTPHCRGVGRGRAAAERLRTEDKRGTANPNWRGRSAPKPCAMCGVVFTGIGQCCGAVCGHKLQGLKVRRTGNGNWVNEDRHLARHYRKLVDTTACSVCGRTSRVVAHHLDEDRGHNEASNLRALCRSCHGLVHNGALVLL